MPPLAFSYPEMISPFRQYHIALTDHFESHVTVRIRNLFRSQGAIRPEEIDLRTTWGNEIVSGPTRRAYIDGPDGFALILVGSGLSGMVVERLEGLDRNPRDTDACRLHPIELKLNSDIRNSGRNKGFSLRLYAEGVQQYLGVSEMHHAGESEPLYGSDNVRPPKFAPERKHLIRNALEADFANWVHEIKRAVAANTSAHAAWPAQLFRYMLPDLDRVDVMHELVRDLTIYMGRQFDVSHDVGLYAYIINCGQTGTTSRLSIGSQVALSGQSYRNFNETARRLFDQEVDRLWPEGWHVTVAPDTSYKGLRATAPQMKKLSMRLHEAPSNHSFLVAHQRFAKMHEALNRSA